ncbi:MAG: doxx family protein [Saprospiraceae bacterium]
MNFSENNNFQKKITFLTISIGVVFFYFGILKFFPNLSPAEEIGCSTVCKLSFGLLPPKLCLYLLATLEVGIGVCLMIRTMLRPIIIIAIAHLVMTFSPLFLSPELVFQDSLISPTLLGQYIYKNVIIICALLVVFPDKEQEVVLEVAR